MQDIGKKARHKIDAKKKITEQDSREPDGTACDGRVCRARMLGRRIA